jgi:hypothetical protein
MDKAEDMESIAYLLIIEILIMHNTFQGRRRCFCCRRLSFILQATRIRRGMKKAFIYLTFVNSVKRFWERMLLKCQVRGTFCNNDISLKK